MRHAADVIETIISQSDSAHTYQTARFENMTVVHDIELSITYHRFARLRCLRQTQQSGPGRRELRCPIEDFDLRLRRGYKPQRRLQDTNIRHRHRDLYFSCNGIEDEQDIQFARLPV